MAESDGTVIRHITRANIGQLPNLLIAAHVYVQNEQQ
jgi:hypothetical protein